MKKIVDQKTFKELQKDADYACIRNPEGVFPPYEYQPLSPKRPFLEDLSAVVSDMDGTTTTTENLCIHSLEMMVRRISGKTDLDSWAGLDRSADYPHIIGNSTTRHVEFLIEKYQAMIDPSALIKAFLGSALWFFRNGKDARRIAEVALTARLVACGDLEHELHLSDKALIERYVTICRIDSKSKIVRCAVDIYYRRYHEILMAIDQGTEIPNAEMLHGMSRDSLIEPMPAVAIFISLIRGLIVPDEAVALVPRLKEAFREKSGRTFMGGDTENGVRRLAERFSSRPVRLALVTSSIFYEADIVVKQVFKAICREITDWELSENTKNRLIRHFSDYHLIYDAFVTANDSHEIRLKPHRDLYSIALYQMHISENERNSVMGFEDSESGTIALRAAGIGCAVALPFAETAGHDLSAAAHTVQGGLAEVILQHHCFLES
ncbi:MAG: hypothetical protein JXR21_00815 [Candidatus Marinimicrobia bacterium]|nr:hypothetical protein [Candidatus Neomarinimicrobiota bacterium]